jgi:beta-lactamase regulating signal transducer with metallopeptidase domain
VICILYVIVVGFLLGTIGVLVERLLPTTMPRRWSWCVILLASIALPGYYRYHHAVAVAGTFEGATVALDAGFVRHIRAIDVAIGRAWLIVTALLGVWALVNAGWVSHMVRASRARLRGSAPSAIGGVQVVVTESLGPATVGVLRSRVVLPRWVLALPDSQRRYIVRHEDEHRRSHDSTLLFLASLAVILLPWNAALWWQLRRLSLAVEMDCDRRVVSTLGDPHAYGSLLLAVAQASNRGPRLQPALLGRTGMLERRLSVLLAPAPLRLVQRLLLPVAAAVLLSLVLMTPHPVIADHAHAHATSNSAKPR